MSLTKLTRAPSNPGFQLLESTPSDRYFDYCLQPYRPRRPPAGRLRSENLLWHSLEVAKCRERLAPPLLAMQNALGRDMTVWGVKFDGNKLWWETYVYDPLKEDPAATATELSKTLAPWIDRFPRISETIPYMMVSFDWTEQALDTRTIPAINLYLTGTELHEGRSYRITEDKRELDNIYRFLEAKRESPLVLSLLKSSIFVDYSAGPTLSKVLIPELFACKRICVAKKRTCDAIYYSGIDVDQLLWFLTRFDYPASISNFIRSRHDDFEHLYFDVGIDYSMSSRNEIVFHKTSYYGTL